MKQLFILAVCCVFGLTARAQTATNTTSCDIIIQQICVSMNPCIKYFSGNTFTIPRGTVGMPIPIPPCPPGEETVYFVWWAPCGTGMVVNASPPPTVCPPAPYSSEMPNCPGCFPVPATVSVNPMTGDLTIN